MPGNIKTEGMGNKEEIEYWVAFRLEFWNEDLKSFSTHRNPRSTAD